MPYDSVIYPSHTRSANFIYLKIIRTVAWGGVEWSGGEDVKSAFESDSGV